MKRIAALLAAILLLISPLSALAEDDAGRIEGPGFDTPEAAVTAYIEAFQQNDLNAMLSTFAMESFVEHYDLAKYVKRIGAYNLNVGYVPNLGEYSAALNLEFRRAQIAGFIRQQYLSFTGATCIDGMPIPCEKDTPGEEFLASIFATDDAPMLSAIEFEGEILEPSELESVREYYYAKANLNNITLQTTYYGGESFRSFAAMFKINGEPYVLAMDVILYGGRWYNLTPYGILSALMRIDSFSGGLSPYPVPED